MWTTRISKALSYVLVVPLISFVAAVSTPEVAQAVTAGSGLCAQTVGSTTGVTVNQVGTDCVITFTNTAAATTWTSPAYLVSLRVLVVAGGAAGDRGQCATHWGHGGGAGQVIDSQLTISGSTTYTAYVGPGGAATGNCQSAPNYSNGGNGSNSQFSTVTSIGGWAAAANTSVGGVSGNNNAGGTGTGLYPGGGGGGAGGAGSDINGGIGVNSDITGATLMYGMGGAGKNDSTFGTAYGTNGQATLATGTVPPTNTGAGGSDKAGFTTSTPGSDGVVIIRYATVFSTTFSANGAASGAPSSSSASTNLGSTFTFPTAGTMAKPGFTFMGWNTAANGSGTMYQPGTTYYPGSSLTYYATWRALITYDSNTATTPRNIESTTVFTSDSVTTLSNGALVKGTPISNGLVFNMNAADSSSIVGSTWYDYNRNGVTASLVGSPTYNSKEGYFQLNGNNNYIDLGTSVLTGANQTAFSASVYFKSDRPDLADQTIMGRYENTPGGTWIIRTEGSGYVGVWRQNYGDLWTGAVYNEGNINCVTVTYDGTTLRIYLNGALSNSVAAGSAGAQVANLLLGVRGYNGTIDTANYWNGRIYSAQGYSRALSDTEVAQNYQLMIPGQLATKANFTLAGFNTARDGSGTSYGTAATDLSALPTPYLRLLPSGYSVAGSTATWNPVNGSSSAFTYTATPPTYNASSGGAFGAANRFPTISGGTANGIALNNPSLAAFTLCAVARYKNLGTAIGTTGRIIGSSVDNWISGFYNGTINEFHHQTFQYNSGTAADTNWHYLCHTGNRAYWDGTKVPFALNGYTYLPPITINKDYYNANSDFELAELVIYDQFLSDSQIEQVNRYFKNTYGITGGATTAASAIQMSPPANYAAAGDTTLYAIWGSAITYDGNKQSSGSAPAPTIITSANPNLASNSGSLSRPGWRFDGWNTAADGSGTTYAAGGAYPNTGNTTLYAKWTLLTTFPNAVTVKDPNILAPYMRFKASDYDATNKIWKDSSGNGRNTGVIGGSPTLVTTSVNTNGSTKSFQVVQGTAASESIKFGNSQLANYTLFTVARYGGSTKRAIFSSNDATGFFGFYGDNTWAATDGASYHNAWLTLYTPSYPTDTTKLSNWYINTDSYNLYRNNGSSARQTATGGDTFLRPLGVNTADTARNSDFQIAEVIIYDTILSTAQIQQVEDYLGVTYGISDYTPANSYASSLSYSFGTTVGGRTDTFTATNGLGTKTFSISPQVNGISLDTSTANGVAVVVSQLVPTGTYNETLTATDQAGATATFNVVLTVAPAVKFDTSTPTTLATTYGTTASLQVKTVGGLGGKLFSIFTNPLGMFSLDTSTAASGYATLSTTGFIKPGIYSVVVAVTDSTSVVSKYTVAVTINSGPVIVYPNGTVPAFKSTNLVLNYDITNALSYSGVETRVADLVASNYASSLNASGTTTSPIYSASYGGNINITGGNYLDGSACISSIATNSMSYFMWINPRGNGVLLDEKSSGWFTSTMDISNGAVRFRIYNGTTLSYTLPSLNKWYYVGLSYNGTTEKAYVNGVLVGSAAVTRSVATNSTNCLSIGQAPGTSANMGISTAGEFLFGALHVYNVPLADTEVAANFETTQKNYLVSTFKSGSYSITTTQGFATTYSLFTASQGTGNKTFGLLPVATGITLDTSTINTAILNISTAAQATNSTTAAVYNETMTATDSVTGVTKYNLSITINPPIAITPTTATTLSTTVGIAAYDTFTATYGTGNYSFSVSGPTYPSAFTMTAPTSSSGLLTVANNLPVGTYYETITVTDSVGATTNYPLTIIVNAALSLAGSPSNSLTTTIGKSASLRINVANGTGTKTLSLVAPVTGITLDTSTLGSGYATLNVSTLVPANTFTVVINGVDSVASTASVSITVNVNKWPVIGSPGIVTSGLKVNLDGTVYSGSGAWLDQSGNGYNATLGSGANPARTNPSYTSNSGGAFSFNETTSATTNYAQIAYPGSLDTFTVSAWAKFSSIQASSATTLPCVICQSWPLSGAINYAIHFVGNTIVGQYYNGGWSNNTNAFTPSVNTWYYITYTVYKVAGNYYEDLYVNGVRQGATAVAVNLITNPPVGSNNPINIGKRWDTTNDEFINGQIGGVSIYGRSLSDTEVAQNFNATGYRYLATNSGTASFTTTEGVTSAIGPVAVANGTQPNSITLSPTVSGITIDTSVANSYTLNLTGLTATNSTTAKTILETVTATDSATASTTLAYTITVNPPVQETYTAASLTTTSGIVTYDTFTASYGTGNKTFALTGSPSTNGFTLTSNGNLALLTVTNTANPGTYNETVTATDAVGATKSMVVMITIAPGPTLIGRNVLTAAQGFAFKSPTFAVLNGNAPFTYTLASQAISPSGNSTAGITFDSSTMTLQATSAVPAGTYSETITVTDAKGASSNFVILLTEKAPIAITGSVNITKRYGELTQQGYTITNGSGNYSFVASTPSKANVCAPIVGTNGSYTYEEIVATGACSWVSPPSTTSIDVLVAGGGGGGGSQRAGGGGGGGVVTTTLTGITAASYYPVNVGNGGTGASSTQTTGSNGADSWISSIDNSVKYVAAGGGGGGGSWVGLGNNGANGNNAPAVSGTGSANAPGNGGGASTNFNNGNSYYYLGGSAGTAGTVSGYRGGNSFKCTTNASRQDGTVSGTSGRVNGGGGGAGGIGSGQSTVDCDTFVATAPNGGAALSNTWTGSTLYFGGGGGGSDGRASGVTEGSYYSNGRGLGDHGAGNGDQADQHAGGVIGGALTQTAATGSNANDNSGGGGGGSIGTTGYNGGSGAILIRYATPATRVTNAISLNTVSTTNGSGSVLLTVPELVTAGTTTETITVTSGGVSTSYAISITILKETSTVALSLPGGVSTAKYGNAITVTAALNNDGQVTFYDSGTAITGCTNVNSSSLIATCTWTPTVIGTRAVTASINPTDSTDYTTATSSAFNVSVGQADTLTVTAGAETFTYNGSAAPVTKPFTYTGLVGIDTLTAVGMIYSGTANDSTNYNSSTAPNKAGTYTITADTTTVGLSTIYSHYVSVALVTGTLTINRAVPTLALAYANTDAVTYSPTATLDTVTATRSGTGTKSFASITPVNCSVDSVTARMSVLQAGYCRITMSVAQDANYLTANFTDTITISKATRTISLTAPVTTLKYYDTTTVTTTLSGGSTDGAITYSLNATPGCSFDSLGGILQATSGTLACTLNATVVEGTNYLTATTASPLNLTIAKANAPVITISPVSAVDYVSGSRAQISPTYSVTGLKGSDAWSSLTLNYAFVSNPFETFSYSDTNTPTDAGTYSITPSNLTLSSGLLSNYQTPAYSSSAINFTINRIAQSTIYIDNVNGEVTTPFTLSIRGGNNPTGTSTFSSVGGTGCSISGNVLTATQAGQCLVRGTLSAGRNYLAVTSDTTTVRVRSYTLIPVFTFAGNPNTAITLSGGTTLTLGSPSCSSGCVPTITSATPNSGLPGDVIILTGTGFTGVTRVIFNVFTNAITFNADSDTQITVQIPAGLVTNSNDSIDVVTPGGTSPRFWDFTVLP